MTTLREKIKNAMRKFTERIEKLARVRGHWLRML